MDKEKLKGKKSEIGLTYKIIAKKIGTGVTATKMKFNGQAPFKQPEMKKLKQLLRMTDREAIEIFFWNESVMK